MGAIEYEDTDGSLHNLNACEIHGCSPMVRTGNSVQWGRQVTIQCPECAGIYIPRHGGDAENKTKTVMMQAAEDWNRDNPVG